MELWEQVKNLQDKFSEQDRLVCLLRNENQSLASSNRSLTIEGNRIATLLHALQDSDLQKQVNTLKEQLDKERANVQVKHLSQRIEILQGELVKMQDQISNVKKLGEEKKMLCREVERLQNLLQLENQKNKALGMEIEVLLENRKGVIEDGGA